MLKLSEIIQELRSMSESLTIDVPPDSGYVEDLQPIIESLEHMANIEQALEDIKVIAVQAMTEPSPMPNALTWDCFVRIRNAVEQVQKHGR